MITYWHAVAPSQVLQLLKSGREVWFQTGEEFYHGRIYRLGRKRNWVYFEGKCSRPGLVYRSLGVPVHVSKLLLPESYAHSHFLFPDQVPPSLRMVTVN